MLGQLGHVFVGLADNVMVGKLGAAALASVSLANGLVFLFLSLGVGFTFAITPLIAQADGEKNIESGQEFFKHGLFLAIILGFVMCILLFFAQPLMRYMKQPEEVVQLAIPYYQVIAYSMIPVMIFQGFKQFADGLSLTKYAMQATIIANVINVFFNYVLIYGKFGFPALGVVGSAYGTMFSRFFMVAFMVFIITKRKEFQPYIKGFSSVRIKDRIINKIFNLGYPTALQMWFEVSLFASGVFLAGMLGTNSQASNQIALFLASTTFMVTAVGLGVTATIRVGNQLGLKNYKKARNLGISAFLLISIIDIVFAIIFFVFKDTLPSLFVDNTEVIETASVLIVIAGLFQLSDGIQAVILGALRGLQDVKIPMVISFIAYWIIGFPICYYLAIYTEFKAKGIWIGFLISLTVSAIMLYLRFSKLTRKLIVEKNEHT